jgi:hypothetical protein
VFLLAFFVRGFGRFKPPSGNPDPEKAFAISGSKVRSPEKLLENKDIFISVPPSQL